MTEATQETKPTRSLKENLQETVEILKSCATGTLPRKVVVAAALIAPGLVLF